MEIYKDIEGYEGYQISNHGNVKSLNYNKTGKEKILKPKKNKSGYLQVVLYQQGKGKYHYIHRLVAQAFIENPNNLPQVNHKNQIKTDNRVENLEFCDAKYNCNFGTRNERSATNRSKPVMCLETGVVYPSANEAARQLGFAQTHISSACNGKYKQMYGYTWEYVS